MGSSEVRWQPPIGPFVKVNFDASFQSHSRQPCSGIIVRNEVGLVLEASIQMHSNVPNAFVVETFAFVRVVCFTTDLGFMHVTIEGDPLAVVKKANSLHDDKSEIAMLIKEGTYKLRNCFTDTIIQHCFQ
ncbi:hypothetical protein PVK06_009573 [Gossypium arboreum]|uniref:RNase H type-1 domain-containing protein n=1 Tax=Gossypium arboreum TaxID=29729 RepID=A0ABR0QMV2_GOSAR|nr:hypothetical protein PVK06_009573 [Gossypium arboreum]